jgi:hypothetical protein
MRKTKFLVLAALSPILIANAASAQAPPVGPGHCVANCGGGSGGSSGGGGGGGGHGGGNAAAIGSAIGLGIAVGTAIMQQQQQQQTQRQSDEQRGRKHKPPTKDTDKDESKTAKRGDPPAKHGNPPTKETATEQPPQKTGTDNAASQAATKGADKNTKLVNSPPPVNPGHCVPAPGYPCPTGGAPTSSSGSGWSDCTSRGGVWGNTGCGRPSAKLQLIPYFVPLADLIQHVDALPCPQGSKKTGETFYGGTKCSPIATQ